MELECSGSIFVEEGKRRPQFRLPNHAARMSVRVINSAAELVTLQQSTVGGKVVVFFWAPWQEASKLGGQLHTIFSALSEKFSSVAFAIVEAEAVPELSEKFEISVVPTFVSLNGNVVSDKFEGANPADINNLVKKLASSTAAATSVTSPGVNEEKSPEQVKRELHETLERLVNTAPVMLFMKGSPAQPKCGFSRKIVEILQNAAIPFGSFDILTNEDVRAGLKEYSDWPTYPQLYVRGTFCGGLDIVKEMAEAGDLKEQLGITDLQMPPAPPSLQQRLETLVNQDKVMLFMKGSPEQPKCGFSRKIVGILQEQNISFSSFDILTDEEVRAGLKEFSDWPTYPQLYVNGTLVGGLDIVSEMADGGDLKGQLGL